MQTQTKTYELNKTKSHAFGKDCYLVGLDQYGDPVWLEAAKWDCDWYWGFGYMEVYTIPMNPSMSRDIRSHSHWSGFVGKQDNGKYHHHINETLKQSVLTEAESWRVSDLMKSFYTLSEAAAVVGRGGSHLSGSNVELIDKAMAERINTVLLPALFEEVYKILSPES